MKWHIEQNKKGTRCVITCNKGVSFISAEVTYIDNSKHYEGAESVSLIVPYNSWKRKKSLKKCTCDPYKNECCDICTGYAEAKRKGKLRDSVN
jgi:hypothetical protein